MDTQKNNTKLLSQHLKEPALKYTPDYQLTLFSEKQLRKGEVFELPQIESPKPQSLYKHPNGTIFLGDSIDWLTSLENDPILWI